MIKNYKDKCFDKVNTNELFNVLNNYINDGYNFLGMELFSFKVTKGNNIIYITDQDLDYLDNFINLTHDIIKPDFNKSQLSLISGIINNFNGKPSFDFDKKIFDKKYKRIIFLLLDGMGDNILERLDNNSFLKKHYYKSGISIYPSTTAAATTSIKTGLVPLQTGWTGWQNYFKEECKNLILFNGKDYYTDVPTKTNAFKVLPYKMFYDTLDIRGDVIEPDFSNKNYNFSESLNRSLNLINKGSVCQYVYDTNPDSILHEYGTKSIQVLNCLNEYDILIENYYNKLPKDTLLIIAPDHSHIDIVNHPFYLNEELNKMLLRKPSNDSRCVTFKVKEEYKDIFIESFNKYYKNYYLIMDTKKAIKEGYFGFTDKINDRIDDFLADFCAFATSNLSFNFSINCPLMKSTHAGLTAEEMLIPFIVAKK